MRLCATIDKNIQRCWQIRTRNLKKRNDVNFIANIYFVDIFGVWNSKIETES